MSKEDCLEQQLAHHIAWFERESTAHKRLHRRLRYIVFSLTALSTALAGLALAMPELQRPSNIAIVLTTAAVGLVTSIEGLRKPSELWLHERTLYYSLKDLQRDLQFRTAEGKDPKVVEVIFAQMQDVLGSARDRWSRQVSGSSKPEP
ncbi:DUF4231 domain-containing protein [Arenimonas oryziterrae]|uniref:SMODS and SLOG-associating 2TM effector domain-containing protein n=1 Tax=Arenimonas oryziterrae DSM 21050 = YC6267 TaxID=1121015 RepID=A0A091AUG2_9GAMM|nr:DUF4231 domain-containing protein [Arenimonas oryziterrae]KFN43036.1 hypothetical protein N789_10770 [Arenimonas oryziterrae DSM 21050 = YC6267]